MRSKADATFIEPMLLLPADTLPEGPEWAFELKLDGFRAIAIKTNGQVRLRSRNEWGEFVCQQPVASAASLRMADILIMMDDEPRRRSFKDTRHALTVALVKPSHGACWNQAINSSSAML